MIDTIKTQATLGLKWGLDMLNHGGHVAVHSSFEKKHLQHLVHLVTAMYLECWLERDENAQQTLSSFAKEGNEYMLQTERKNNRGVVAHADRIKALQRAEQAYLTMQKERKKQAEKESSAPTMFPELQSKHQGKKYSFCALRHMDLLASGNLELYKLLTSRTHLMTVSVHRESERYISLLDAYDKYDAIFKQAKNISSDREYVAACMQMRKFESAFRFLLIARMAVYFVDRKISITDIDKRVLDNFELIWGRFAYVSASNVENSLISEPYDILHYDKQIECAFASNDLNRDSKIWRSLLLSADMWLRINLPLKERPSWTDKDFTAAAQFFKTDYPIFESHTPLWEAPNSKATDLTVDKDTLLKSRKKYAERVQDIYQKISEIPESDLNDLRSLIKPSKKKSKQD